MRTVCAISLVLALFGGTSWAQGNGSIVIHSTATPGTPAGALATYLENQITKGLLNKYPCTSFIDDDSIRSLLSLERQRELLGRERDDAMLQNLAGALGAQYIIAISASTMPNGQTSLSAWAMNTATGKTIASAAAPPASGDAAADGAEALAAKLLQNLSDLLKGDCEGYWAGTITVSFKQAKTEPDRTDRDPGGGGAVNITIVTSEKSSTEDTVEAELLPRKSGDADQMAKVSHRYDHQYEHHTKMTSTIKCGASWTAASRITSDVVTEDGQGSSTELFGVSVDRNAGRFSISVHYPALSTKRHEDQRDTNPGNSCEPKEVSSASSGEGGPESEAYRQENSIELSGSVDPKNPDTLSGSEVKGDLAAGQYKTTWKLQLVKPKPRAPKGPESRSRPSSSAPAIGS